MIVPRAEFHSLVAALVPFTRLMLEEHGRFLPLGGIVKSGEVVIVPPSARAPATVQEWLLQVKEALRQQTADADCAAVAYCVDVRLSDTRNGDEFDAVQLVFEHRSGEALDAFFPYRRQKGRCGFAQPMLRIGAGGMFPDAVGSHLN